MSDTYTKLFSSITESTVWGEPYATRVIWVAMLAMADARGNVYGSLPGLARRANVTLEEVERALSSFLAPDPYSRTRDEDGRRIDMIDGGWHLINHGKYGAVRNADERREYKREWDRKHRGKAAKSEEAPDNNPDAPDTNPTNPTDTTPPAPALALTPEDQEQDPIGSSASADAETPASGKGAIPHQAIVDAYNAKLPQLAKVRELTTKRRTLIRSAWQASIQRHSLAFWQAYFAECAADPFLNGTGPYREPHENWRPNFDYLLKADVVTRVFEQAMDRMDREAE